MAQLEVIRGSLTDQSVEAIVNAANTYMRGGGGIDGRIHELAGPEMLRELQRVAPRGAAVGEPLVTPGFQLSQRYVIHVAGPIWRGGEESESEELAKCYLRSLLAAHELGVRSVGFCSISTGAFGFPLQLGAQIAIKTLREGLDRATNIQTVVLAMFGREEFETFSLELTRQPL